MGPFAYANLSTIFAALVFITFLYFLYFSKKNVNNIENKIYSFLIINTGIALFVSLLFQIAALYTDGNIYTDVTVRLWYGSVDSWVLLLSFYIVVVANEKKQKVYDFFNSKICFALLFFIIFIIYLLEMTLPFKIGLSRGEIVSFTGVGIISYYFMMLSFGVIALISVLINKKNANKKKLSPFYLMLVLGIIALTIAAILPQYFIVQLFFTLAVYLMFFTIENPDIKVISELEFARDQAEKANHAKSDFLSSMSHELRTPLNAIIGLTSVIKNSDNMDEIHTEINNIAMSSEKLLELVDAILEVNQIDSNNITIEEKEYKFSDIISSVETTTKVRIGDKPISFYTKVSPQVPNILFGDKEKIRIIINNLVSNAVKYTTEGSVELSIDCLNAKDRCNLRISVSDTGKGIKDEDIENIFNKFFRSEENKDSDIEGAGLGLSITKSLVELMDGKISVNSNLDQGSTFTVTISQKIVEENNTEIL